MSTKAILDRHAPRTNHRALRHQATRWLKRGLLAAAALAVLAILVYAWLPKPVAVEAATAGIGPLEVTVDEDGKTRVHDRYVVAAPISGNLERVELDAGTPVAAGQVLARIVAPDPALLDPRTRDQAAAQLAAAIAREHTAGTAVIRARATAELSARDAERTRQLVASGAVAASMLEHDDLAAQVSAQELAAAGAQQRAAAADVAAMRAVLGSGGKPTGAVLLPAPVAGRVLHVVRDSAGPIAAGAPIVELGDPRALEIVVDVLSSDGARIAPGMPVAVAGWGGNDALAAIVDRVEPSAFTKISALGVEEQRVNVIVKLTAPPASLGDGFRVEARIVLWRGDALTVPASAAFRDHGHWAVYAIESGRARLRRVELGHIGRLDVEIASGLAPGMDVILHPGDRVADGTRVSAAR
jgi:HlyD family secretion protein